MREGLLQLTVIKCSDIVSNWLRLRWAGRQLNDQSLVSLQSWEGFIPTIPPEASPIRLATLFFFPTKNPSPSINSMNKGKSLCSPTSTSISATEALKFQLFMLMFFYSVWLTLDLPMLTPVLIQNNHDCCRQENKIFCHFCCFFLKRFVLNLQDVGTVDIGKCVCKWQANNNICWRQKCNVTLLLINNVT